MERVHFISEETIRLLLSVIFKLTTKKLTRGYCFTPNMLPNQRAALSFILLTLMYWSSEFLFVMFFGCKELWLRTGSKDRLRYIPLHEISTKVGPKICKVLPAFHALTGSVATSAFARVGKKRAYNILEDSEVHQESLSQLGQITFTEDEIKQCVKFVFSLYPTTKKTLSSLDELRYLLFCQKRQRSEALPPTSCLLYTSPSPRDLSTSRMPSSA